MKEERENGERRGQSLARGNARTRYPGRSYERRRIRDPRNTSPRKVAFPCKSFCRSVDYHLRLSIMHASLIGSKRAHPPTQPPHPRRCRAFRSATPGITAVSIFLIITSRGKASRTDGESHKLWRNEPIFARRRGQRRGGAKQRRPVASGKTRVSSMGEYGKVPARNARGKINGEMNRNIYIYIYIYIYI